MQIGKLPTGQEERGRRGLRALNANFRDKDDGRPRSVVAKRVRLGSQRNGVMARYVAFLLLGSAFVIGMVMTVQTHRLVIEPKAQFTNTPVNYVDSHWPPSVPATLKASLSR
jgi:hypothetical protein